MCLNEKCNSSFLWLFLARTKYCRWDIFKLHGRMNLSLNGMFQHGEILKPLCNLERTRIVPLKSMGFNTHTLEPSWITAWTNVGFILQNCVTWYPTSSQSQICWLLSIAHSLNTKPKSCLTCGLTGHNFLKVTFPRHLIFLPPLLEVTLDMAIVKWDSRENYLPVHLLYVLVNH